MNIYYDGQYIVSWRYSDSEFSNFLNLRVKQLIYYCYINKSYKMFEDEIFEENLSKVDEFYIEIDLPGIELNQTIKNRMKKQKIRLSSEFTAQIRANIVSERGDGYFFIYQVHYGWFLFQVTTFNLPYQTFSKAPQLKDASDRIQELCKMDIQIKQVWSEEYQQQYHQKLLQAMKKIVLVKLYGVLNVYPTFINKAGFDIITYAYQFYYNDFEEQVKGGGQITIEDNTKIVERNIKAILKVLHSVKIIHGNIKGYKIKKSKTFLTERQYFLSEFTESEFVRDAFQEKREVELQELQSSIQTLESLFKLSKRQKGVKKYEEVEVKQTSQIILLFRKIYNTFLKGRTKEQFIYENAEELEKQVYNNLKIYELKDKKQFYYINNYSIQDQKNVGNSQWYSKVLNLVLRHHEFKKISKFHPDHPDYKKNVLFFEGGFQIMRKLLLYINSSDNLEYHIRNKLTSFNLQNVEIMLKLINLKIHCIQQKIIRHLSFLYSQEKEKEKENVVKQEQSEENQKGQSQCFCNKERQQIQEYILLKFPSLNFYLKWEIYLNLGTKKLLSFFQKQQKDQNSDFNQLQSQKQMKVRFKLLGYIIYQYHSYKETFYVNLQKNREIVKKINTNKVKIMYYVDYFHHILYPMRHKKVERSQRLQKLIRVTPLTSELNNYLRSNYYHIKLLITQFRSQKDEFTKIKQCYEKPPLNCLHFEAILQKGLKYCYYQYLDQQLLRQIEQIYYIFMEKNFNTPNSKNLYKTHILKMKSILKKQNIFNQIKEIIQDFSKDKQERSHEDLYEKSFKHSILEIGFTHLWYESLHYHKTEDFKKILQFDSKLKLFLEYIKDNVDQFTQKHYKVNIRRMMVQNYLTLNRIKAPVKPKQKVEVHFSLMEQSEEQEEENLELEELKKIKKETINDAYQIFKENIQNTEHVNKFQDYAIWYSLFFQILIQRNNNIQSQKIALAYNKKIQEQRHNIKKSFWYAILKTLYSMSIYFPKKVSPNNFIFLFEEEIQRLSLKKDNQNVDHDCMILSSYVNHYMHIKLFIATQKKEEFIEILPNIIHIGDGQMKSLYIQFNFYLQKLRKSQYLFETIIKQIEKIHLIYHKSKNVVHFYYILLMRFHSFTQQSQAFKKCLMILRPLLQQNESEQFFHLSQVYHRFLKWKFDTVPSKNHKKILNEGKQLLYSFNFYLENPLQLKEKNLFLDKVLSFVRKTCQKFCDSRKKYFVFCYRQLRSMTQLIKIHH